MNGLDAQTWRRLLRRSPADAGLSALYGPLLAGHPPDGPLVLGRIAQSLDGRIATTSGASHWISGPDDIAHTHRLRALFDAVVVGAGTVRADDPLLTTRVVEGPSPVRVVLDPRRRLDARFQVFQDGPETLLFCAEDAAGPDRLGQASVLRSKWAGEALCIRTVLAALAARGLHRVFVEGGGVTVSRFLAAGVLDRLHVTVAPLLLGGGVPAFVLPHAASLTEALRFDWTVHRLGADLLLDIPLRAAAA
ncbi:MAG TPA: RibD family protein [Acetobacteraceae bacterium]|jgi:diaminohydroxyphosphoribosylaminopyrimidine deaminase/5-amino-6-(5-phosphoribosylamino)uracil reductase|nr:RibD family protein [Acetobacteraceae bacterium]